MYAKTLRLIESGQIKLTLQAHRLYTHLKISIISASHILYDLNFTEYSFQ